MSVYTENFETIFGIKNNIQSLKNKFLELAVQGKLIEQDKNDKSATELVKKIKIERDKLVKEGKMKERKNTSPISEKEIPFEIPKNWEWVRFDDIAFFKKGPFGSSITKSMFVPKGINNYKVYEQKNAIQKDYTLGDNYITEKKFNELKNFELFPGDIIVSCAGTIGETYILPSEIEQGIINQALMKIELSNLIEKDFFLMFFDTILSNYITAKSKGSAMKNIPPLDILKNIPFAVPSHNEQIQIIKKFKSYMSEINKYEEKLQKKERITELISKSVVDNIGKCQTEEEFKEQLQFIIENFETIFQTLEAMQELRNVVLQLSIEGKLVPQDDNDEPASELLKKIKTEKDNFFKEGKINKEKALSRIEEDEIPFNIPENWKWIKAGDLCDVINYGYTASALERDTGTKLLRITDIQNGRVKWDTVPYCEIKNSKVGQYKLNQNDIVIARTGGTVGKSFIIKNIDVQAVYASYLIRMIPNKNLNPDYYYLMLNSPLYWVQVSVGARGGAQPNVNSKMLSNLILPLPPLAEQHRIVQKVESIMRLIDELENKLKHKFKLVEKMVNV